MPRRQYQPRLTCTSSELIFFLDADHVPSRRPRRHRGVLRRRQGRPRPEPARLLQPGLGAALRAGRHEQSLFFEVVCPGKDRHNGVFWCGSATLLRRTALVGWAELPLRPSRGLPHDYQAPSPGLADPLPRRGPGPGNSAARPRRLPVAARPLGPRQPRRPHPSGVPSEPALRPYSAPEALLFRQPFRLRRWRVAARHDRGALCRPGLRGVAGAHDSDKPGRSLGAWSVLAIISASALCRGHLRSAESFALHAHHGHDLHPRPTLRLVPSRTKFKVTPKEGVDTGGWRSYVACALDRGGRSPSRRSRLAGPRDPRLRARPAPPGLGGHLCHGPRTWELYRLIASFRIIFRRRQRRAQVRFACLAPATIGNQTGHRSYGRVVTCRSRASAS